MNQDYLSVAKETLLKGDRLGSIHVLLGNITDESTIRQLHELEIRQNSLNSKVNEGTIDFEDMQMEENRISSAILTVVNQLQMKRNKKDSLFPSKGGKKGFDIKWLIIALLAMALLAAGYFIMKEQQQPKPEPKAPVPANPCAGVNCKNGGKCYSGRCKCPDGYVGEFCQTKKPVSFSMEIEDVFTVTGRGLIVTGKITSGEIKKGDKIEIVSGDKSYETTCLGIEKFRKRVDSAKKGEDVGLLLKGVEKSKLKGGMLIRKR